MGFEDPDFWTALRAVKELAATERSLEAWQEHAQDLRRQVATQTATTNRLAVQLAGVLAMADLLARSLADAGDPDGLLTPKDGIIEIWGPEPSHVGMKTSNTPTPNKKLVITQFAPQLPIGSKVKPGDELFRLVGNEMFSQQYPIISPAEGELIAVLDGEITQSQIVARIRGKAAGVRPFMVRPQGVLGEAFLAAMRLRSEPMGVDNPDAFAIWPRTQAKNGDSVSPVVDEGYAKLRGRGKPPALEDVLKVERAHSAGLMAQAVKLRDMIANSGDPTGILAPSGEFRRDNHQPKTLLSKVYDDAFDQKAKEQGIQDPASLRP